MWTKMSVGAPYLYSLNLIGFICIQLSHKRSTPVGKNYSVTSMTAVCFSSILLVLYVFHVVEKYQHRVPWLKIELAFYGLWSMLILTASSYIIASSDVLFMTAGHIGLRTSVAYGIDFYIKWGAVLRGHLAQEERIEYQVDQGPTINTQVPATNSPGILEMRYSTLQQRASEL